MLTQETTEPTNEERRHAVCMAMARAPGLVRFAARFTRSIDDAEDAYQRAMEIALTRAPVTDPAALVTWLHTVIRREATAIAETKGRELPLPHDELEITVTAHADQRAAPDAVFEWRERYRAIQDAVMGLTDAQRVCLMLRSAGASHGEIQTLTGFSERKVHRSIMEGRARLHAWEIRMAAGEECGRIADLIDRTIDETATRRERRALSRHIGHCPSCRSRFRSRRDQIRMLGSLVPAMLVGGQLVQAGSPDPSLALAWWERLSGSAGVRAGQAVQMMLDVPALASTKAGAGAIAAVAAGALGAPMVVDAVRPDGRPPAPARAQQSALAPSAWPPSTPRELAPKPSTAPAKKPGAGSARATARSTPKLRSMTRTPARAVTYRPAVTTGGQAPKRSTSRSPAALEFGP